MNDTELICNRCGSPLKQINSTVRQTANPLYPITITQYQCTNMPCQKAADSKQAEVLRLRLDREEKSKNNPHAKKVGNS